MKKYEEKEKLANDFVTEATKSLTFYQSKEVVEDYFVYRDIYIESQIKFFNIDLADEEDKQGNINHSENFKNHFDHYFFVNLENRSSEEIYNLHNSNNFIKQVIEIADKIKSGQYGFYELRKEYKDFDKIQPMIENNHFVVSNDYCNYFHKINKIKTECEELQKQIDEKFSNKEVEQENTPEPTIKRKMIL